MKTPTTAREQWKQIWLNGLNVGDRRARAYVTIARMHATAMTASGDDERWFEAAVAKWSQLRAA